MGRGKRAKGIYAMVGAASGLGNALRFPSLCAQYGGAFMAAYVCALVFVCFPLLCAELGYGRRKSATGVSSVCAAVNSAVIASYYAVLSSKIGGAAITSACGEFGNSRWVTLLLVAVFALTVYVVLRGGAERMSRTGKACVACSLCAFLALAAVTAGCGRLGEVFSFGLPALANGGLWADALGQSLLSLSLAGGVMPTFASTLPAGASDVRTAACIIAANLCLCVLSATCLATAVPLSAEVGIASALGGYSGMINAAFTLPVMRRAFGVLFFSVLWFVAVQSACTLFSPLIAVCAKKSLPVKELLCVLSVALFPLYAASNCAAMSAVDRMCCTVVAVSIAFAEGIIFLSPANKPCLRSVSPAVIRMLKFISLPACAVLAMFSVCGARFSCFPAYAVACAFAVQAAVIAPVAVWAVKRRGSISHKTL